MKKPGIQLNGRSEGFSQGHFYPTNPKKYIGKWPIVYRSSWEKTMMRFLDINENIIEWGSENIKISYNYFDPISKTYSKHTYFPDFAVKIKKSENEIRVQIIEIKPFRETKPPKIAKSRNTKTMLYEMKTYAKNQAKWEAAKEFCRVRNWDFLVLTEKDLPKY